MSSNKPFVISISDMHCAGCVAGIEKALHAIPGVEQASVNFADKSAMVVGAVSPADILETVKKAGFTAHSASQQFSLKVSDMHCAGCVASIEKALRAVPGVEHASVNFADKSVLVVGQLREREILDAVKKAGFHAQIKRNKIAEDDHSKQWQTESGLAFRRALVAASVGVPLMFAGQAGWLPGFRTGFGILFWSLTAVICLWLLSYSGRAYYVGAWKQLKVKRANMDSLVALGTLSAWVYSVLVFAFPQLVPELVPGSAVIYILRVH